MLLFIFIFETFLSSLLFPRYFYNYFTDTDIAFFDIFADGFSSLLLKLIDKRKLWHLINAIEIFF